jgi:hypothetical protein
MAEGRGAARVGGTGFGGADVLFRAVALAAGEATCLAGVVVHRREVLVGLISMTEVRWETESPTPLPLAP